MGERRRGEGVLRIRLSEGYGSTTLTDQRKLVAERSRSKSKVKGETRTGRFEYFVSMAFFARNFKSIYDFQYSIYELERQK